MLKISLFLLSTLFSFALIEGFLRWSGTWRVQNYAEFDLYETANESGYRFKKKLKRTLLGKSFITNQIGLRDSREPSELNPKCQTVLLLGGSYFSGFGVSNSGTLAAQLEQKQKGEEVCREFINAGVNAYSSKEITSLLENLIPLYKPDMIVYEVNALSHDSSPKVNSSGRLYNSGPIAKWLQMALFHGEKGVPLQPRDRRKAGPQSSSVFSQLYLHQYFSAWWKAAKKSWSVCEKDCIPFGLIAEPPEGQFMAYSPIYWSTYFSDRFYHNLNRAIGLAAEAEIPILFLTIDSHIQKSRINKAERAYFLDLTDTVGMTSEEFHRKYSFAWDFHPRADGWEKVAEGLAPYVESVLSKDPGEALVGREFFNEFEEKKFLEMADLFTAEIDFQSFKGIHQLIGGLRFDGMAQFPVTWVSRAVSQIRISGTNTSSASVSLRWEALENPSEGKAWEIPAGPFQLSLPNLTGQGLLTMRLSCMKGDCNGITLDRISK